MSDKCIKTLRVILGLSVDYVFAGERLISFYHEWNDCCRATVICTRC